MSREIMQQALKALKFNQSNWEGKPEAIEALEAALAQLEQALDHPNPAAQHWHDLYLAKCKDLHDRQAMLGAEIAALEEELEELKEDQIEQKPVAWMLPDYGDVLSASEDDGTGIYNIPLYTAPPRKEWVGLTDDEIKSILDCGRGGLVDIKKVEQTLKDKNT